MENWQQVKDLFAEALEQPVDLRIEFLKSKSNGDELLFAEVSSLLAAAAEPENLIENNALDLASSITAEEINYTDRHFGNYKIIREIGSGGMGTVFLAERDDGEFTMQVALKIVRQSVADRATLERFKLERQILAQLHHPNIAILHDGGVSDKGEPYLAMEHVEGETLIEYADRHRLSISDRLRLFLRVCSAVSYAHRNLVVHRDLKPSNILVTADGEPKLLDFGLAKALSGDSQKTQTMLRAFTPAYASPEQINGDTITTASDIYSLGVVFYELLTGAKPLDFENKSFEEIIRTVTSSAPPLPSENPHCEIHDPQLKGDLDNIALTTLRKEPERRYNSVEAIAGDIERYLHGQPISARPNTFSYLASKFFQRNKVAVTAAALVIFALIAGMSAALWQASVARTERDRAEKRFNDVRQLSNSLLFEITPKIENLNGSTEAREILVKRALEYLDSLAGESQNDTQLQSELASAYEKIGELQANTNKPSLNDAVGSIESYVKAQKIRGLLPESVENQKLLAENLRRYSDVIFAQNDVKGSLDASTRALTIYEHLLAADPTSFDLQTAYIEANLEYGATYSSNNQYDEAIPIFQKALADLSRLDQDNREVRRITAVAIAQLANAYSWDDRQSEAETEMARAVKIVDELVKMNTDDSVIRRSAFKVYALASGIYEDIKNEVALEFAEKALQTISRAVEADAADSQAKSNQASAFSRVGGCLVNLKNISAAIPHLQKAENLLSELTAQEPKNLSYHRRFALLHMRFGGVQTLEKNYSEAVKSYQKSADLFAGIAGLDDKNTLARRDEAQSLKNVGEMQIRLNQNEAAQKTFQRTLEILTTLKSQNALSEVDLKMIDEAETALAQLSKTQ